MRLLTLAFLLLPALSFADPPNVVLILSDDQAWSDYSFMGHEAIQTPHIDKLAAEGMTYTRGYVPTSLCRPSLMTFATGRYPHQHKVTGNDPIKGVDRNLMLASIMDAATTLMDRLGEVGYVSHHPRQVVGRRACPRWLHPRHDHGDVAGAVAMATKA